MKKYFRYHRGGFLESMGTMTEVTCLDDIRELHKDGSQYKNIRIGDGVQDDRCVPFGWGDMTYYVVADFDEYTGQCIGMCNFKD